MNLTDMVSLITAISALIGAIAAALWGRGLSNAKDEIIKAKDAQIDSLRSAQEQMLKINKAQIESLNHEIEIYKELTPSKIREYFVSVKMQLEEYNEHLQVKLETAQKAIENKDVQHAAELERLQVELHTVLMGQSQLNELLNSRILSQVALAEFENTIAELDKTKLVPLSPERVRKLLGIDSENEVG